MLSFLSNTRVYLAVGATDLRKCFDTLAGVVRESLRLDPLSGHLFVFTNSRKNRIKILFWDNTGWWVCAKPLEAGTLAWPVSPSPSSELSSEELTLLLGGIDLAKTHRRTWLRKGPQTVPVSGPVIVASVCDRLGRGNGYGRPTGSLHHSLSRHIRAYCNSSLKSRTQKRRTRVASRTAPGCRI